MKVVATALAFYQNHRVKPGTVLEVPEGFKAKWAKPVPVKPEPVLVPEKEPDTFSEITHTKKRRSFNSNDSVI